MTTSNSLHPHAATYWRCALIFSAAFHALHFVALPMLMTFDGADYVKLGRLASGLHFNDDYYFARPPLYPLIIETATRLLGRTATAIQLPNLVLGFLSVWLAGLCLRRAGFPRLAIATVVLLTIYPTFVAYEHAVLTEIGSICCVLLSAWLVLSSSNNASWRWTVALGLAIAVSYYQRPTLLYLAPMWGLLRLLSVWPAAKNWKQAMAHAGVAVVIGWALALPWQIAMANSNQRLAGGELLIIHLLKQGVLPPDDPLLTGVRDEYEKGLLEATINGRIDAAGIHQATLRGFMNRVAKPNAERGGAIVRSAAMGNPGRYISAVWRTWLLFSGSASLDDENDVFTDFVIGQANDGGKVLAQGHDMMVELSRDFAQRTDATRLSRTLDALRRVYAWLIPLGVVMTVLGFAVGVWNRHLPLLTMSAPALAFMAMHAVVLFATNRYVLPVYPLLLINILLVPAVLWRMQREGGDLPQAPHNLGSQA